MGADVPKQFLKIGGRTILHRTMDCFASVIPDLNIVTVLPREHIGTWKRICIEEAVDYPQQLVEGGITRFHSVRNALDRIPDGAFVAVHDGVRPFVSEKLLSRLLDEVCRSGSAVPVMPVVETLRSKDPGVPSPQRSSLMSIQTPQFFFSEDLKDAYRQAYDVNFTDDSSVLLARKKSLSYVEGERLNIKITTPDDLRLAEVILPLFSE